MSTASNQIINYINEKQPRYVRKPKPTFGTVLERERYWDKQKKYWREGFEGLTGPQYFYLQEGWISDSNGKPIVPLWRDGDDMVFEAFRDASKIYWALFLLKRREYGLSGLFGGVMPLYFALLNPGAEIFMTSADKDRIKLLFHKKLMVSYNNLDDDIRSPMARVQQSGFLFLAEEIKGKKGQFKGLQSQIWCKESILNPAAFEAFRAQYGFLDELFLHKKASQVRNSSSASMMRGSEKVATLVMGGSCGIGTNEGINEGKKIYADSKNQEILTVFLPGTLCIEQYSHNGHSDQAAAYEWIQRERDKREKADDLSRYWQFVANYPLSAEEVLSLTADSILPQEIINMLNQSEKSIRVNEVKDVTYDIQRQPETGSLTATANPKGKFHIIVPPIKGRPYGSGLDPIPFGNAKMDTGSDLALIIKDRLTMQHVAYYMERNMDSSVVFHNCSLLQDLYHSTPTNIEITRGEQLYLEYRNNGRLDLVTPMPTKLGIHFEKRKFPHGTPKNTVVEERCNYYFMMYLYSNANNMVCQELINQVKKWTKENTDLLDAALMEILDHANQIRVALSVRNNTVTAKVVEVYRDPATGQTHKRIIETKIALGPSPNDLLAKNIKSSDYNNQGVQLFKRENFNSTQ